MDKIKKTLAYKIAREIKNFFAGIADLCYWHVYRIIVAVKEHSIEKRFGIETSESYRKESDASVYKDLIDYHASSYEKLRRIFDYLKLGPEDVFVDLGCGKGRALFVAAQERLKKVIGVEVDKDLVAVARENCRDLRSGNTPVEIVEMDAALYKSTEGTVFFMYDPFGYKTMETVISNIKDSLAACPRRIRIVYFGPGYRHLLDREDWLELEKNIDTGNILVWHNHIPSSASSQPTRH